MVGDDRDGNLIAFSCVRLARLTTVECQTLSLSGDNRKRTKPDGWRWGGGCRCNSSDVLIVCEREGNLINMMLRSMEVKLIQIYEIKLSSPLFLLLFHPWLWHVIYGRRQWRRSVLDIFIVYGRYLWIHLLSQPVTTASLCHPASSSPSTLWLSTKIRYVLTQVYDVGLGITRKLAHYVVEVGTHSFSGVDIIVLTQLCPVRNRRMLFLIIGRANYW